MPFSRPERHERRDPHLDGTQAIWPRFQSTGADLLQEEVSAGHTHFGTEWGGDTGAASVALAEERICRGTLGAITVDNLRKPQGATCTLNGTRVQGTVKVEWDATLST